MFVELNVNIGINDLRVKIEKIKQKLASKKVVRVTIQINTRQSKVDSASALLLNFSNMIQADMYAQSKPSVFKQGSEDPESIEEVESLEDLDTVNTDFSKQDLIEDEENLLTDPKVVIRQSFLPVRKAQIEAPQQEIQLTATQLSDEEIVQLIREKYSMRDVKQKKELDLHSDLVQNLNIDISDDSPLFTSETLDKATRFSPQFEEFLRFRYFNGNPHKNYRKAQSSDEKINENLSLNYKNIRNKSKSSMMTFTENEDVQKDQEYILPIVEQQPALFDSRQNVVKAKVSSTDKTINQNLGKLSAQK